MSLLQAVVLGLVQGATEFLPISSSGHLVLVPWLLGWQFEPEAAFVFDVLVQLGTILAVIAYFRSELRAILVAVLRDLFRGHPLESGHARLGWLLLAASVPAAITGILIKPLVEQAFQSPAAVSGFLLVTATLLGISERLGARTREVEDLRLQDALWIGAWQALALFPGISRSGSTIAGALIRDLERPEAARFSFLMSIPVMIGAGLIAALDLLNSPVAEEQLAPLLVGFISAAITGYLAIRWLLSYLARRPLTVFVVYCAAAGIGGLALAYFRA